MPMTRSEILALSEPYTIKHPEIHASVHAIGALLSIPTMGASLAFINLPAFFFFMKDAIDYNTKHQRY